MNILQEIQRQIEELEQKIADNQGDLVHLQHMLKKLKIKEIEENKAGNDGRQLLKG